MLPEFNIPTWRLACLLWMIVAAWSATSEQAWAGTIDTNRSIACDVRFAGDLESGDAEKLVSAVKAVDSSKTPGPRLRSEQEIERGMYIPRLCLNSKGGSFDEAVTFVRATITKMSFATVVEKDAECYSACALVFMTGHHNQGDGYVELYRRMHVDGQVGFHAPFIPAMGSATSEQLLNRSYRAGVEAVAELLNLDQRFFPRSLLAEFLKVGPDKFFKIEQVRQLAAWDIGLVGYRRNRAVAAGQVERACRHHQLRDDSVYHPQYYPQWEWAADENLTTEGRKRVPLGPAITRHVIDAMGAEGASRCVTLLQMHGNVLFLSIAMVTGEGSNPRDPGTKPNSRSTFFSTKVAENIAQADPDTYTPAYFLYAGRTKLSALPREGQ